MARTAERNSLYQWIGPIAESVHGLYVTADSLEARYKTSDLKLALVLLKAQVFIAASNKTEAAIVAKWNSALTAMKKDGTFKTIFRKYFPDRDLPGPEITRF